MTLVKEGGGKYPLARKWNEFVRYIEKAWESWETLQRKWLELDRENWKVLILLWPRNILGDLRRLILSGCYLCLLTTIEVQEDLIVCI